MNILLRSLLYVFTILVLSLFTACSADGLTKTLKSPAIAFGKVNRINVICDKDVWEGPLGDSIRYYYGAPYSILPQPEPLFDLHHITMAGLRQDPILKELRTYIIVADLSDKESEIAALVRKDIGEEKLANARDGAGYGTSVARNKWAKGQVLIYIYGNTFEKLEENILTGYSAVGDKIQETNKKMIDATTYFNGVNRQLSEEVFASMKVRMRIPTDYYAAISENNLMWLRRETSEVSNNILLCRIPYTDESQLSREGIKHIRDSIGRKYISSDVEDSYMRINDVDLPLLVKATKLNGNYAIEARGIWDIVNDFMGGAFVSYLIYDPEKEELLFMDCFVHAPGKKKRNILQSLDHILQTAEY